MKTCSKCRQEKCLSEFRFLSSQSDGLDYYCRSCRDAGYRKYATTEKGRKTRNEAEKRRRDKGLAKRYIVSDEKSKAHSLVNRAIRSGDMPPAKHLQCALNYANCLGDARDYHHHNGYEGNHALDVIPVCRSCHKKFHADN